MKYLAGFATTNLHHTRQGKQRLLEANNMTAAISDDDDGSQTEVHKPR
jgi:hypothetical protein